ncbi:hypothetical protein ACSSV1_000187 [Labrenzia sp. MBR-25]
MTFKQNHFFANGRACTKLSRQIANCALRNTEVIGQRLRRSKTREQLGGHI